MKKYYWLLILLGTMNTTQTLEKRPSRWHLDILRAAEEEAATTLEYAYKKKQLQKFVESDLNNAIYTWTQMIFPMKDFMEKSIRTKKDVVNLTYYGYPSLRKLYALTDKEKINPFKRRKVLTEPTYLEKFYYLTKYLYQKALQNPILLNSMKTTINSYFPKSPQELRNRGFSERKIIKQKNFLENLLAELPDDFKLIIENLQGVSSCPSRK